MTSVASDIAHLLRRAGFGAKPAEIEAASAAGYQATVEQLLAGTAPGAADPQGDQVAVPRFAAYQKVEGTEGTQQHKAATRARLKTEHSELAPLQDWWLDRMIVTATPLREKMTLLWHGHFATAVSKVKDPKLMYLQNQLFRTMGTGSFEALTQAVATSGAMMIWLDTATDKKSHPNENFARELMELFTLGVGNYSQDDVEAAARCFTGWTYDRLTDQFAVQARQHDDGVKTFLGVTANLSGADAITTILAQPASARFVTTKVWNHLAYPVTTTDPIIDDLVGAYGSSMDLTNLLRTVFNHPAFLSPASKAGLVKQPIEYLVGAARALGLDAQGQRRNATATPPDTNGASGADAGNTRLALAAMVLAQTPFDPSNVGGWPQNGYWLNTATALARLRIGEAMAARADLSSIAGASISQRPAAVAQMLGVVDGWGPTTTSALAAMADDPPVLVAAALNSPEYILN